MFALLVKLGMERKDKRMSRGGHCLMSYSEAHLLCSSSSTTVVCVCVCFACWSTFFFTNEIYKHIEMKFSKKSHSLVVRL